MSVCTPVCPSVTNRADVRCGGFLLPIPQEIWVSSESRLLELSQTSYSQNFATASTSRCQQLVDVVDGRVCWRHLYDNRRVVAVYYTSRSTVTLSLLTSICCGFVLKLVYTVDKILTDIMRCVARTVLFNVFRCTAHNHRWQYRLDGGLSIFRIHNNAVVWRATRRRIPIYFTTGASKSASRTESGVGVWIWVQIGDRIRFSVGVWVGSRHGLRPGFMSLSRRYSGWPSELWRCW